MKTRNRVATLVAFALSAGAIAVIAQQGQDVQIVTTHVRGPIHMLEGRGGNIGVSAGDDGVLIIDDQFEFLAEKIKAAIAALDKGKIKYVLNTHWHGDHTGGNGIFGREAPILAHENVRKRLASGDRPAPSEALPVITYEDGISIHFNGEEIRVVHFPRGHTDGDSVIWFTKSNVVHMGDHFFSGRFPFIDLRSGGDVQGFVSNVDKVIAKLPADVKIIPGHGPLSTLADLKTFRGMLGETIGAIEKQVKAGKSLDEIKAAGLDEKWASWGTGFINTERWITIVHESLTRDRS